MLTLEVLALEGSLGCVGCVSAVVTIGAEGLVVLGADIFGVVCEVI